MSRYVEIKTAKNVEQIYLGDQLILDLARELPRIYSREIESILISDGEGSELRIFMDKDWKG